MKQNIIYKLLTVLGFSFLVSTFAFEVSAGSFDTYDFKVGKCRYKIISKEERTVELIYVAETRKVVFEIPGHVDFEDNEYEVVAIKSNAFIDSDFFSTLIIPASVTSTDFYFLSYCTNLIDIIVDENNPIVTSSDGIIYDKDFTTLIRCPKKKTGIVKLPETVTTIGPEAFEGCKEISEILLNDNLTTIENYAFQKCEALTKIDLPKSLNYMGEGVFSYCKFLSEISFPESLNYIARETFQSCTSLKSITVPNSIENIYNSAFKYCTKLLSVTLPESLTFIGAQAFSGCTSLESIYLPERVDINSSVFNRCFNLSHIEVNENNPYLKEDNGMLLDKNSTILYDYPTATGKIVLPETLFIIRSEVFAGSKITEVILPESLLVIEEYVFPSCTKLETIVSYAVLPPELSSAAFGNIQSLSHLFSGRVFVPNESFELYKISSGWNELNLWPMIEYAEIMPVPSVTEKEGVFKAYSIEGKLIHQSNQYQDLINALPSGLYIINGRKVMVK